MTKRTEWQRKFVVEKDRNTHHRYAVLRVERGKPVAVIGRYDNKQEARAAAFRATYTQTNP